MDKKHFCYILINESCTHSYVGYTVNPTRRLRQHNGELKGGAMRTKRITPGKWRLAFIFECDKFDNHLALSFEWHLKDHRRKRERALTVVKTRMCALKLALANPKFKDCDITMYFAPEFSSDIADIDLKNVAIENFTAAMGS